MVEEAHGGPLFRSILSYVDSCPEEASVELNALYGFLSLSLQPRDKVEVYLYPADTNDSWLCARVLEEHLKGRGFKAVELRRVRGLGAGVEAFSEALSRLAERVISDVRRAKSRGLRVYVNASAYARPESAFMVMVAATAGADEAYYLHEEFRSVVRVPLPPLSVDPRYAEPLRELAISMPVHAARSYLSLKGLSLTELMERGLVEERDGEVVLRGWLVRLLG